jgi:hypothetical protein
MSELKRAETANLLLFLLLEPQDLLPLLLEPLEGGLAFLGGEWLSLGHGDVLGEVPELVVCPSATVVRMVVLGEPAWHDTTHPRHDDDTTRPTTRPTTRCFSFDFVPGS